MKEHSYHILYENRAAESGRYTDYYLGLEQPGYANVTYKIGDGSRGWEENAPFNRIGTRSRP